MELKNSSKSVNWSKYNTLWSEKYYILDTIKWLNVSPLLEDVLGKIMINPAEIIKRNKDRDKIIALLRAYSDLTLLFLTL